MPQNPILRIEPGATHTIALKYQTGKEVKKTWGVSYVFTLTDGRVVFFPPEAEREIKALHVNAGEPFTVRKLQSGDSVRWEFERVIPEPGRITEISNPVQGAPSSSTIHNQTSVTPHSIKPSLMTGQAQFLLQQLIAADEACAAAENYAHQMGRDLHYSTADRRAVAISCYSAQSRERGL